MKVLRIIETTKVMSVNSRASKCSVDDQAIMEIGKALPLVVDGKFVDMVIPYEYHVSEHVTIIFFTYTHLDLSEKAKRVITQVLGITSFTGVTQQQARRDSDTGRTGMDAATRMMTGDYRTAREIGRDAQYDANYEDDDDDDSESLFDMMRRSNPNDPLFR